MKYNPSNPMSPLVACCSSLTCHLSIIISMALTYKIKRNGVSEKHSVNMNGLSCNPTIKSIYFFLPRFILYSIIRLSGTLLNERNLCNPYVD